MTVTGLRVYFYDVLSITELLETLWIQFPQEKQLEVSVNKRQTINIYIYIYIYNYMYIILYSMLIGPIYKI